MAKTQKTHSFKIYFQFNTLSRPLSKPRNFFPFTPFTCSTLPLTSSLVLSYKNLKTFPPWWCAKRSQSYLTADSEKRFVKFLSRNITNFVSHSWQFPFQAYQLDSCFKFVECLKFATVRSRYCFQNWNKFSICTLNFC